MVEHIKVMVEHNNLVISCTNKTTICSVLICGREVFSWTLVLHRRLILAEKSVLIRLRLGSGGFPVFIAIYHCSFLFMKELIFV